MGSNFPIVCSITSGKGGVGKTNISVNIACGLARAGKRVVLLDADLGLANVDVLLGLTPPRTLFHVFNEDAKLDDVLFSTPYGFSILPASSGICEMSTLDTGQRLKLLDVVDALEDRIDYLLVDTGAGINENVIYFNIAAQERLVVLTPEPTSLTDAYALIKVLKLTHGVEHFKVLVNMASDEQNARLMFRRLYQVCDHFLSGVSLDFVGMIPHDVAVREAVIQQKPFTLCFPNCAASVATNSVVQQIQQWEAATHIDGNIKFFWKKLLF